MSKLSQGVIFVSVFLLASLFYANNSSAQTLASQPDDSVDTISCSTTLGTNCTNTSDYSSQTFIPAAGTLDTFYFKGNAPTQSFFNVNFYNNTNNTGLIFFGPNNYVAGKTDGLGYMTSYTLKHSDFSRPIVFNGTDTWTVSIFAYSNNVPCQVISCFYASNFLGNSTPAPYFVITDSDGTDISCTTNCNDSVLFLPGITGSRLYEDNTQDTNPGCVADSYGVCTSQRWLPTTDNDVRRLYLDDDGNSINSIYSKDVLGTALYIADIYDSFLDDLYSWKNEDRIIADYSAIPYDWRFSASEIIARGTKDASGRISYSDLLSPSETPYIISEVLRLAESSRTNKVTIIAHSNGGLVAKELMLKLRELGKEDLVSKLILVAVPEVGTPDALKVLLHGVDIGPLGLISDARLTREFVQNMSTAYDLLPSSEYFDTNVGIPLVSFDDSQYFDNTRNQYGFSISSFSELKNYLKNLEGRVTPSYNDLNNASILNNFLIDKSDSLHSRLDAWEPTSATKVIEVAGWGEYTLGGVGYRTEKECIRYNTFLDIGGVKIIYNCLEYKDKQVLDIIDTLDGDGTVVQQSAHYMSNKNTGNTEKWWVDLNKYNNIINLNTPKDHKNILEISDLLLFIKDKIKNSTNSYSYISQDKPSSNRVTTRIKLNSPLTLSIYDSLGNHTGLTSSGKIEENIPGSRYRTIGESKYIIIPKDVASTLKLQGYQEGSFSLSIDTLEGDTVSSSTAFSAIPSSASTIVTLDIPAVTGISTSTPLQIDFNGDDIVDTEVIPKLNEELVYDTTPPELKVTFNRNTKNVSLSAIDTVDSHPTINTTDTAIVLEDGSGNKTTIPFIKQKEDKNKLKFSYDKITRNSILTNVNKTHVVYEWKEKKGVLTDLDTKVTIKGVEKYVFSYKKETNMTTIKIKTGTGTVTSKKSGVVPVTLVTNKDSLDVYY